jgi:hypothetical protein
LIKDKDGNRITDEDEIKRITKNMADKIYDKIKSVYD